VDFRFTMGMPLLRDTTSPGEGFEFPPMIFQVQQQDNQLTDTTERALE
jgi:hypothetical protein